MHADAGDVLPGAEQTHDVREQVSVVRVLPDEVEGSLDVGQGENIEAGW